MKLLSKFIFPVTILFSFFSTGCGNKVKTAACDDSCGKKPEISCKLTSPELQKRKATVIDSLKKEILETRELDNGYSFRFPGNDEMVDKLTDFVKTERQCCDFFTFTITVSGDKSSAWMELTGPEGTKAFIKTEMGL